MLPQSLERVARIRNLGVFRDLQGTDETRLRRWNLIYGFNGTGKTTLSRLFASIGEGKLHHSLPPEGTFSAQLSDGTPINDSNLTTNPLLSKLHVFNTDFIDSNIRWDAGTSSPIFYIGRDQAEAAAKMVAKQATLQSKNESRTQVSQTRSAAERELASFKRATARTISDVLGLGRRYEAPDLTSDFESIELRSLGTLDQTDFERTRKLATMEEHLPRMALLNFPGFSLDVVMTKVREVAARTIGSTLLTDLAAHEEMLGWAKAGLDYHRSHRLQACLFCGNNLGKARINALAEAVDRRFDELLRSVEQTTARVENAQRECIKLREQPPSPNEMTHEFRPGYERDLTAYRAHFDIAIRALGEGLAVLGEKRLSLNRVLGQGKLLGEESAKAWDRDISSASQKLIESLNRHNASYDNFSTAKLEASRRVRGHYITSERTAYEERLSGVNEAKESFERLVVEIDALNEEIEALARRGRQHGPAATAINRLLHSYLGGRTDIELVPIEGAFRIHRNGLPLTGPLSEGEKTAIALCYFLIGLEAEGRKTKDLIVVVDDPISSLDSKALNYVFSMIRRTLGESGQLIVLTHNLHFMNEVKKWLKRRARDEENKPASASLLFIETTQDSHGIRSSRLTPLPRFLRDYESEYHYLFSLVLMYSRDAAANEGFFYLMPNAIRKVMEIFFAFHLPGPEGIGDKMQQISQSCTTLLPVEVDALDRLAQVESHSDSLDDFVTLSPMTVEETSHAVDALIKLMAEVAPGHVARMKRICS